MARKWRHETMVKRGGRAYVQSEKRVEETAQGELAVPCRACPIPGVNLPTDWADAPPERQCVSFTFFSAQPDLHVSGRFLYALIVCIDTCFRFKNRLRSSDEKDPTLGPGWSYMVDHGPYIEHVKKYASEAEVRTYS